MQFRGAAKQSIAYHGYWHPPLNLPSSNSSSRDLNRRCTHIYILRHPIVHLISHGHDLASSPPCIRIACILANVPKPIHRPRVHCPNPPTLIITPSERTSSPSSHHPSNVQAAESASSKTSQSGYSPPPHRVPYSPTASTSPSPLSPSSPPRSSFPE